MFNALGKAIVHRPWVWVATWLILVTIGLSAVFAGFGYGGLFERMATAQPATPNTESQRVHDILSDQDAGEAVTLVVSGVEVSEKVPELMEFMADHRADFTDVDGVKSEADPFIIYDPRMPIPDFANPRVQAMLSSEGNGFVVALVIDPDLSEDEVEATHDQVVEVAEEFRSDFTDDFPDAKVHLLSTKIIGDDITALVQQDLVRGEAISMPVALILLIIVFGGLLAAGLPLVGSIVAIVMGMAGMWVATFTMDINNFILNVISIIGLALSIDYGLLVVSRYREEMAQELIDAGYPGDGSTLPDRAQFAEILASAVVSTVTTAGRTVVFSAMTIACSIMGLLVFVSPILRSIALGGMIVTLLAVATAVTLVPSFFVILGRHLVRPSLISKIPGLKQLIRSVGDTSSDRGMFSYLAHFVHRIPVLIIIVIVAVMALTAWPISTISMRTNFIEYLPEGADSKTAYALLQDEYPALASPEIIIVAEKPIVEVQEAIKHINDLDDVDLVLATPLANDDGLTRIDVHMDTPDRVDTGVVDTVLSLRDYDPGYGFYVGGDAAMQHDFTESLIDRAPWAMCIVAAAVIVLLFLMTGSLIVPLKALVLNLFSLTASLGATVWIFQGGHLGMPHVLGLETFIVACMVAFGFGLSMDYEVFLVARIKEYWDAGMDNDHAVERGLQRSGRIITSAAAIIIAVFVGFVSGEMLAIKEIGVALAIMVAVDATLVRMLLVPATMTILGRWNWWAPKPLARIYQKYHLMH